MGVRNLMRLLHEYAPLALKEGRLETHFQRKIAIDASMALYQFLIAVRHGPGAHSLVNEAGDVTSHLTGFFYRTIRLMEAGIQPIYVFDGKPPDLKMRELQKRKQKKIDIESKLNDVISHDADDNQDMVTKLTKQSTRVTKQHNEDVKKLLRLMGIPIVEAPQEAEAQCAHMCKQGLVYATASEDMDVLAYGSPRMLRHLTAAESAKKPVVQIDLECVLTELRLSMPQFIDLCMLCGCDYVPPIPGIGVKRAYELILKHKSLHNVLAALDPKKHPKPEDYPFEEAAKLFQAPEVVTDLKANDLKPRPMDVDGLMAFLGNEKHFQKDRIEKALDRLTKAKKRGGQHRLDSFFAKKPKDIPTKSTNANGKRSFGVGDRGSKTAAQPGAKRRKH